MQKTVHISDSQTATFVCPGCEKTKTVDVSRYTKGGARTKVHSKCTCGSAWTSILERRKNFRIAVNLTGSCMHQGDDELVESMPVRIIELSATGVKFETRDGDPIRSTDYGPDDFIAVDFYLDNRTRTHVRKTAFVRNVNPLCIGAEFADSKQVDQAIGDFIWSRRPI